MALNLNQSNVDPENQVFIPMLTNLQANILKGHGRSFAYHLFFKFNPSKIEEAKTWIKKFAATHITSSLKQLSDTKAFNNAQITDGGTIYTLSLSASGYKALGLQALMPQDSPSFISGMKAQGNQLGDDQSVWEDAFTSDVDLFIMVADDSPTKANSNSDKVLGEVSKFASVLLAQRGNVLKMSSGTGIEHFGYADGISQPLYLKEDISKQHSTVEWNDQTDLSLLLVSDRSDEPDSFGSYLVFRKLDQDVQKFKDAEGDNDPAKRVLPVVLDVSGHEDDDLPGAMLVGRFENSVPVVKSSTGDISNPPVITNDFNYKDDKAALKCPFHSHIRLMNPRNGDTAAGDISKRRITRRAIPYDDIHRFSDRDILKITEKMLDDNQPNGNVGLLFMCYQSNIDEHFNILQEFWANQGNINGHHVHGQDSLIGQGTNPAKTFPSQWGKPAQSAPFHFGKFVTNKGGEYFFTPCISFLKAL